MINEEFGETLLPIANLLHASHEGLWEQKFSDQYILFVHGWRMKKWERIAFAETALKRLYWEGYKGKFGLFSWPTDWFDIAVQNDPDYIALFKNTQNYNRSEALARRTSRPLRDLLVNTLGSNVRVLAHSMGNVVVSEALRGYQEPGPLMNTYIASQAAEAADGYNPVAAPDVLTYLNWIKRNFLDASFLLPPDKYSQSELANGSHYFSGINNKTRNGIFSFYNPDDAATVGAWEENQLFKPKRGGFEFEGLSVKRKTDWWGYSVKFDLSKGALADFYWVNRNWEVGAFLPKFKVDDAFLVDELPWAEGDSAYDIMSYIIPARSKALGAQGGLADPDYEIKDEVDLKAQYGLSDIRFDHSAQFFSTNIKRQSYWNRVIDVFGF